MDVAELLSAFADTAVDFEFAEYVATYCDGGPAWVSSMTNVSRAPTVRSINDSVSMLKRLLDLFHDLAFIVGLRRVPNKSGLARHSDSGR